MFSLKKLGPGSGKNKDLTAPNKGAVSRFEAGFA
jgi:hypothetical protein